MNAKPSRLKLAWSPNPLPSGFKTDARQSAERLCITRRAVRMPHGCQLPRLPSLSRLKHPPQRVGAFLPSLVPRHRISRLKRHSTGNQALTMLHRAPNFVPRPHARHLADTTHPSRSGTTCLLPPSRRLVHLQGSTSSLAKTKERVR